eukprot:CAMPEP_0180183704 /NCGR_PEP_ID=MMETSP0986-20121125/41400_1 /TAXON_ID=697907 /ORGANISM="non described non described, Strain CCMP2293" /LENGTH=176 /DNA_ID=CAMNT_0022137275 /DNA_START=66 /DNA_END=592 /DNA_ORIENTATION=-
MSRPWVAALRSGATGAVFGSRAASPRGALLPGRTGAGSPGNQQETRAVGGEHCSGLRPACALTVVPPHLLAWLRGALLPGRPGADSSGQEQKPVFGGEHCSGLRSAFALTVVPARRLPLLSLGGGARSAGARVADALALSAMELDTLITQSRNARELMELVQQHGQKFTAINLSAA